MAYYLHLHSFCVFVSTLHCDIVGEKNWQQKQTSQVYFLLDCVVRR